MHCVDGFSDGRWWVLYRVVVYDGSRADVWDICLVLFVVLLVYVEIKCAVFRLQDGFACIKVVDVWYCVAFLDECREPYCLACNSQDKACCAVFAQLCMVEAYCRAASAMWGGC